VTAERKIDRFEQGDCLNCGHALTGISREGDWTPAAGDIMVCGYCNHLMEWTGERLAELSDQAIKDLAGDKEVLASMAFAARFQRSIKEKL
jgi:hypothetical protein